MGMKTVCTSFDGNATHCHISVLNHKTSTILLSKPVGHHISVRSVRRSQIQICFLKPFKVLVCSNYSVTLGKRPKT